MAYKIEYDMHQIKKTPLRHRCFWGTKNFRVVFIAILIVVFLIAIQTEGGIIEFLYPGEGVRTQQALEQMAQGIRAGESITDAFTRFCRDVIEYA